MVRLRHPNIVLVMGISLVNIDRSSLPKGGGADEALPHIAQAPAATGFLGRVKNKTPVPDDAKKTVCIITEYLEQA